MKAKIYVNGKEVKAGFNPNQPRTPDGKWGSGGVQGVDDEYENARKIAEDYDWDGDSITAVMLQSLTESNFHSEVRKIRSELDFSIFAEGNDFDYAEGLARQYDWDGDSLISLMMASLTESNFHSEVRKIRKLFPNL